MSSKFDSESVLDDFIMEMSLTHAVLRSYIEKYPSLALELTDLFHELAFWDGRAAKEMSLQETKNIAPDSLANTAAITNALSGDSFRALARRSGLPRDFFAGFRDGHIRCGSIPEPILSGLAQEIGVALQYVVAFLLNGQQTSTNFAYKAQEKPSQNSLVDYNEFINGLELTEHEEAALARLGRGDGFD